METLCEIYVAGYNSADEVLDDLKDFLKPRPYLIDRNKTIVFSFGEIYVNYNESFDWIEQKKFPDGFLFFPFILELDLFFLSLDLSIHFINQLIDYLWTKGLPAIVVSEFDERLKFDGGYNRREVPFPT